MVEKFDEFVSELERDIRQERFLKIWHAHGKKIMVGIAAFAAVIAFYFLWQSYESGKRLRLSQKFTGAQELIINGQSTQAIDVLRELTTNRGSYQNLAQFLLAALLREPGPKQDIPGSLQLYEALVVNNQLKPLERDFALLMVISLRMTNQEPSDALLEKLKPLLAAQNPWHLQAMELQGVLLSQKGETMQAAEVFASIARDARVSQALLTRAQVMAQVLLQETSPKQPPAKPLTETLAKEKQ